MQNACGKEDLRPQASPARLLTSSVTGSGSAPSVQPATNFTALNPTPPVNPKHHPVNSPPAPPTVSPLPAPVPPRVAPPRSAHIAASLARSSPDTRRTAGT